MMKKEKSFNNRFSCLVKKRSFSKNELSGLGRPLVHSESFRGLGGPPVDLESSGGLRGLPMDSDA